MIDTLNRTSGLGGTTVNLNNFFTDTGDTLSYRVVVSDPLFDLKTQYGLDTAEATQYRNFGGQNLRWLHSSNQSNLKGAGWFVLTIDGRLHAWDGGMLLDTTLATTPVARLGSTPFSSHGNFYDNPALLTSATIPTSLATLGANVAAGTLTLSWPTGTYTGTFRTTVYAWDGVNELQQSFLVNVT